MELRSFILMLRSGNFYTVSALLTKKLKKASYTTITLLCLWLILFLHKVTRQSLYVSLSWINSIFKCSATQLKFAAGNNHRQAEQLTNAQAVIVLLDPN